MANILTSYLKNLFSLDLFLELSLRMFQWNAESN